MGVDRAVFGIISFRLASSSEQVLSAVLVDRKRHDKANGCCQENCMHQLPDEYVLGNKRQRRVIDRNYKGRELDPANKRERRMTAMHEDADPATG